MPNNLPPIGSYVRAIQINGLFKDELDDYLGSVCRVTRHDKENEERGPKCKFPDGREWWIHEWETSTEAEFDAELEAQDVTRPDPAELKAGPYDPAPEAPEPEKSTCIICEAVSVDGSDCDCPSVGFKTASAVLEAGNDALLQWLRLELEEAEHAVGHDQAGLNAAQIQLNISKSRELTILDLIAARMDQLKKGNL